MKILLLNEKDIRSVFTMSEAIDAAADALAEYSTGKCVIPLRTNIDVPEGSGQSLYMQGYCAKSGALGVKIVSVYPNNIAKGRNSVPATMVLLDEMTGETCALLDGTCLTRLRTGAVSGTATRLLANNNARVGAIFGTGGQAETQLEAMLTARPKLEIVRVFDVAQERAEAFAEKMQKQLTGFSAVIHAATSPDDAVREADIVTTVTTSRHPVFRGELLKDGAHVNAVGAYTPQMQEIDETVLRRATKIFVDTRDGALNESGDFLIPFASGAITRDNVTGELGELIEGRVTGRESESEISVFETVGTAALDLVTAKRVYLRAKEKGIGQTVDL